MVRRFIAVTVMPMHGRYESSQLRVFAQPYLVFRVPTFNVQPCVWFDDHDCYGLV